MAFYTAINVTPGKGWNAVDEYYTGLRNDEWYQRSQDQYLAESTAGLVFPWGRISIDATLASPERGLTFVGHRACQPCDASLWWIDYWACGVTEPNKHTNGETNGLSRNTRRYNSNCVDDSRREEHPQPANHGPTATTGYSPSRGTTQVSLPSVLGGAVLGEAAESIYEYFAEPGLPAGVNGAAAACATKPSDIVYKWSEKDQRYVARKNTSADVKD